jgi:hypothetical protein
MRIEGVAMRRIRLIWPALVLGLFIPSAAQGQQPNRFFQTFNGRVRCNGQWYDFQVGVAPGVSLLGIVDPDEDVAGSITFYFRRSATSLDGATFTIKGPYDQKTGAFRLEPKEWVGPRPPAVFDMFGLEGRFDFATETPSAKILGNSKCDAVELAGARKSLPPLPAQQPVQVAAGPDPKRPERRLSPSNVTNYLDVAAYSSDFEYWVTAWSEPPGTIHEAEPIDESIARMKADRFMCGGSQRVTWETGGMKGTAPDRVGITERFVIECVGDCKGVFYRPYIGANVTHFGLSAPLPTMQIKSIWAGGQSFRWNFSRTANTQPPPEVYVHRWIPLAGFGPFDSGPEEVARRQAAAPPCKAPKPNRR